MEKFYANNIETNYPEIYELLIDKNRNQLSSKQRFSIITFVVSQVLRTSKLANTFTEFWNQNLAKGYSLMNFEKGIDKIHLEGGGIIDFKGKTLDQVKKEQQQENIEIINIENLKRLCDISLRRMNDGIAIKKMHSSYKLITSDNPAYFDHNIYDPNGFARLPLDEDHLLILLPFKKDEKYYEAKEIVRSYGREDESYVEANYNNMYQIHNSERFIIGKKSNIESALDFQKSLNADEFVAKCEELSKKAQNMLAIAEMLFK